MYEAILAFIAAVFGDSATNLVLALLLLLPIVDWVTGSLRAVADGSFQLGAFDVFVRTQLGGRSVPLAIVLITGRIIAVGAPTALVIPGLDLSLLTSAGIVAAVPFLAKTVASIIGNVNPSEPNPVPTVTESEVVTPTPVVIRPTPP